MLAEYLKGEKALREERRKLELEEQRQRQATQRQQRIADARELFSEGWPAPEIAKHFEVTAQTIKTWLRAEVENAEKSPIRPLEHAALEGSAS